MKMQRTDEELMQSIKELLYKKEVYLEREGIKGNLAQTMAVFTLKQLGWRDCIEIENPQLAKVEELLNKIEEESNK